MAWWNCNYNGLEPETANLIEKVDYTPNESGRVHRYKCGCEKSFVEPLPFKGKFWFHICDWHDGYDNAVMDIRGQE